MDAAGRSPGRRSGRLAAIPPLLAAALAALLLVACGDDTGSTGSSTTTADDGLRVVIEPARARAGGTVQARVVNDSGEMFTYGAAYELERRVGEDFERVPLPPRPVPDIGYIANPGEAGPPVAVRIPGDALPGQYRVVIQRDVPNVGDLSGEFAVTANH